MHLVASYISDVAQIHSSGLAVKETSYYPALEKLLNGVGKSLKPAVHCVINISGGKSGIPDGGFFTLSERKTLEKEAESGSVSDAKLRFLREKTPERGVLEVKGDDHDLETLKNSEQVAKYLARYGLCLVTNYRQFEVLTLGENGAVQSLERFSLFDEKNQIFGANSQLVAQEKGEELLEFLRRALLRGAPLQSPQDVAAWLASYARQARLQLESVPLDDLAPLKIALENALGVKFQAVDKPGKKLSEAEKNARGDHFFRGTLVQTLFYGLFSAWLEHVKTAPREKLNWRMAQYSLHVPMIETLFSELVKVGNLRLLELENLLELATARLNDVDQTRFFEKWGQSSAIQYFYEPFLEAFDPILRKDLGVYYTPPEIVSYMVERVHRALQTELGIEDGLADEQVTILDPCCGTGAFVLETLRVIACHLDNNKPRNQVGELLKKAATTRVFGFEILPAPFVVAHHGVANLLGERGVKFSGKERAPIFLTNALTGWDKFPKTDGMFAEFKQEVEASQSVKQKERIWVILGNPPYDAFAKIEEEGDLTGVYKRGLREEWGIKKWNFGDLYLRFFRIAERKLAANEQGILCYISNFSYLREPSFVVMRKHLLETFGRFWIDVLNGDSRETGKRTPDKLPDPSVFSTDFNREGIKVGTAISLMVRAPKKPRQVFCRQFWGVNKRAELLESLEKSTPQNAYSEVEPEEKNRFSLRPRNVGAAYSEWPTLPELCDDAIYAGVAEDRRKALISNDVSVLRERMQKYFDKNLSWDEYKRNNPYLTEDYVDFNATETRKKSLEKTQFEEQNLKRFVMRPFDLQWCYFTTQRPFWRRSRPDYAKQVWEGNSFLLTRFKQAKSIEGAAMYFATELADYHCLAPNVSAIPHFLQIETPAELSVDENGQMVEKSEVLVRANLSAPARAYLESLGVKNLDDDREAGAAIWHFALAMGYSPNYRHENAGGLSGDWPRIPLPNNPELLRRGAKLGARIGALLDSAKPFEGIETGKFIRALEPLGELVRTDKKPISEGDESLRVSQNWGFFAERGIVQPGGGKIETRVGNEEERKALDELGYIGNPIVVDVFLNEKTLWRGVPLVVWEFVIGGYQVLKKWLSYRDERVLGRALKLEEAREFENIVRRLTLICVAANRADEIYQEAAQDPFAWAGGF